MKIMSIFLTAALGLLISSGVYGEFYQYTDQDGIIRYTDDPSIIPADRMPMAQRIDSVESEYPPVASDDETGTIEVESDDLNDTEVFEYEENEETGEDVDTVEEVEAEDAMQVQGGVAGLETSKKEKTDQSAELDIMRDELMKMYSELESEKKALGDPPPKDAKSGAKSDYVQKSNELNEKIQEYNKRSNEFDEKVKVFNTRSEKK